MEVLQILQENLTSLYEEELSFLEVELKTGPYEQAYVKECLELIQQIRAKLIRKEHQEGDDALLALPHNAVLVPADLEQAQSGVAPPAQDGQDELKNAILSLRNKTDYKSRFKALAEKSPALSESMVEEIIAFLQPAELETLLTVKSFGESFLEKHFDLLDKDKLSKHQQISESFFIRHFEQLDPTLVLKNTKNSFHKKENRSTKLDVFLRLKGIKQ